MFTGIIEEIGKVQRIIPSENSFKITIKCSIVLEDLNIGDSIAVNGVCLTVTNFDDNIFIADIMHETLNRSSLGSLNVGCNVNIERALSVNGRFGGHIVSGHIDGTGKIVAIKNDDNAVWYTIKTSDKVIKYVVEKGSITIDGISLTVAKVSNNNFSVCIIPHTKNKTILYYKNVGDIVNLENDIIGKYVEKFVSYKNTKSNLTYEFLNNNGF